MASTLKKLATLVTALALLFPSATAQELILHEEKTILSDAVALEYITEQEFQEALTKNEYFLTSQTVQYTTSPTGNNIENLAYDSRYSSPQNIQYGPCTLTVEYLHLRGSSNYGKVGYKTRTTCSEIVESIQHDTDLRYKSALWWLKAGGTTTSSNRMQRSLYQQNVEFPCKNTIETAWSGTTLGTIVHKGKAYYARVYPPVNTLKCGA